MSRRLTLLLGAVALLATTACGAESVAELAPAATAVTIEHKYGTTTVPTTPQRVLTLGFQEQDAVFALGVKPVAVRYWIGPKDDVVFPWAEQAAGDADPQILQMAYGALDVERIAALSPDLILGTYSGITEQEYATLSRIAPTVAQSGDYVDFGMPWQESTRTIGVALGRADRAEQLIDGVEERFAALRADLPGLAGKTVAVATSTGTGTYSAFASADPRARVFTDLGMVVPDALDEVAGDSFFAEISPERTDLLDTDVVVWNQLAFTEGGRAALDADPLVARLAAVRQDRALYLSGEQDDALQFGTVLSLPYLLDELEPLLTRAAG